jgi:hypothetical protein
MPNAGQWGVGIGTGAATGAGIGTAILPGIGTGIGAGLGAGLGALSTLLTSSDEAKKRKKALEEYERQRAEALHRYTEQTRNKDYAEWEQRYAARHGLNQDPMYAATHHDVFDPNQAAADFNARSPDQSEELGERYDASIPPPNYAALAQSLGQLGGTIGGAVRQSDAQERLDGLIQSRKNGAAQAQGMPWGGYANPDDPWGFY